MSLLTDEQAHPIALLNYLTKEYGPEWMGWSPVTLRQTIAKESGTAMATVNVHKSMAAAVIATRDEFWEEIEHFHFLCQALNNNLPINDVMQEHTVGQMMVAVDIATRIRKSLKDLSHMPKFSDQVARYVASHALNQGIWYLPAPLGFAAKYAAKEWYRCKQCGNEAELQFSDGHCDVCVERWDSNSLKNWAPNKKLAEKWGGSVEVFEKNPTPKVKARLELLLEKPNLTLQETRTDICVARLLVSLRYLEHRRQQQGAQAA